MRSTANPTALILVLALALAAQSVQATPRKIAAAGKAPRPVPRVADPETVYVQVTPSRETPPPTARPSPAPASRFSEPAATPASAGNIRKAYGVFAGFYNAEVLGNNPFGTMYWDLYPRDQSYFFEFTAGGGTAQSGFSRDVIGADQFENNWLASLEALAGWTHSRGALDPERGGGLNPYFVAGMTALWQGGIPNVGAVLGFGNRMGVPFGKGRWALNYGMRDHIYSQKIRNEPSLTQNFVLLIGTQKYF